MRVVLDTNAIVSALIFGGRLTPIRTAMADRRLTPVMCDVTRAELARVLTYPKFNLSAAECEVLMGRFVGGAEMWPTPVADPRLVAACRDENDVVFLSLAKEAGVSLVSGDRDLTSLRQETPVAILSPMDLVALLT